MTEEEGDSGLLIPEHFATFDTQGHKSSRRMPTDAADACERLNTHAKMPDEVLKSLTHPYIVVSSICRSIIHIYIYIYLLNYVCTRNPENKDPLLHLRKM